MAHWQSFSERNGLIEPPQQLKIGDVSQIFRRRVELTFARFWESNTKIGFDGRYFDSDLKDFFLDFWVIFLGNSVTQHQDEFQLANENVPAIINRAPFNTLFDFIEFCCNHDWAGPKLLKQLQKDFSESRQAYRLLDSGQIVAVGSGAQAAAFDDAIAKLSEAGNSGALQHLSQAGGGLRDGDWAGSIRESIHAVESVARRLAPTANTLGPALAELERSGTLHPALKRAFSALYGFTSDSEGIRHASVFADKPTVDETDALFMLGACASFVSYLLDRSNRS